MVLIGLLAALAAPSETWFCTLNADAGGEGYLSTYVVSNDRVTETRSTASRLNDSGNTRRWTLIRHSSPAPKS